MGKLSVLVCAITLAAYSQIFTTAKIVVIPQNQTSDMYFIGTIEGKSFFADTTKRTWSESKKYCEGRGMHLVSITTVAQRKVITEAYNKDNLCWWFWTGGRDKQNVYQLTWDHNEEFVSRMVVSNYRLYNGMKTCLALLVDASKSELFDFENCSFKTGVICEWIHGIA